MAILKRIRSVFLTSRTNKDPSPDEIPILDENPKTTVSSEPREKHSTRSASEDAGPALEATPDSSSCLHLDSPSIVDSQTDDTEEQPSEDTSDDDPWPPEGSRSANYLHPESPSIVDLQSNASEEQPSEDTSGDSSVFHGDDDDPWPPEDISLPKVTISAFTETGQAKSSFVVPKQRAYTGRKPVISSRLTDILCATLGVQGLLDQLNSTLRTSYTLDDPSLSTLLEDCIADNYDFGMAYGCLRRTWYIHDWSAIRDALHRFEEEDRERRRKAFVGNRIQVFDEVDLPPRRVWDLYSNRVVPWWTQIYQPQPISHAWVDAKDRVDVWTPINGYKWPVPIPKNTSLDLVRIEMLNINLGAECMWLDVLCLRQVGGPEEDLGAEERKLDVPTIRHLYHGADVVIYLGGLGRPLRLKDGDLDNDRCWFRCAWTVQEVGDSREKKTNPVDKVAGLAFLMRSEMIPAYYEGESLEDAWTALVNLSAGGSRAELFSFYPEPGNASAKWRPSWDQLMAKPLPRYSDRVYMVDVDWNEEMNKDSCHAHCVEKGLVRGLGVVEEGDRYGELIVEGKDGTEHVFNITAAHEYPIPEGTYILICTHTVSYKDWVIGRRLPGERFEKMSVLRLCDEEEWGRLKDLYISEKCRNILV
ncbi:hypothetical protein EDD85DRAFT_951916 [Armillaria nabsnona]|nr:hypothetical protein EDD85DRAFT_951916 [Armillaria nabsnona]